MAELKLRNLRPDDAAQMYKWLDEQDSLNQMWQGRDPDNYPLHIYDLEGAKQGDVKRLVPGDFRYWQAIETSEGTFIGEGGLIVIDEWWDNAEFGLLIPHPDYQNKEYSLLAGQLILQLAFQELNIWKVWLDVFNDNLPAIKLYEELGFRCEGMMRQQRLINGRRRDVCLMGLIKDEYYKIKG